jgi:hypothetical protein
LTLDSDCEPGDAERIVKMCKSLNVEMLTLRLPTDKSAWSKRLRRSSS